MYIIRRPAACLLLISLFLITQACGNSEPIQLDKLPADAVILAFGDSLTFGTGAKPEESYPAVLQALSGRTVINAGIPGELSADGMLRLSEVIIKHQPDLLVLCHGGNDLLRKKSKLDLYNNLITMVNIAQSQRIPVVMLGVPKPGLFLSAADVYAEVADKMSVLLEADILPELLGDNAMKSDTVHPNKAGYRKLAEAIYTLISEHGGF